MQGGLENQTKLCLENAEVSLVEVSRSQVCYWLAGLYEATGDHALLLLIGDFPSYAVSLSSEHSSSPLNSC